jgi:hypothetical protein
MPKGMAYKELLLLLLLQVRGTGTNWQPMRNFRLLLVGCRTARSRSCRQTQSCCTALL